MIYAFFKKTVIPVTATTMWSCIQEAAAQLNVASSSTADAPTTTSAPFWDLGRTETTIGGAIILVMMGACVLAGRKYHQSLGISNNDGDIRTRTESLLSRV